MTLSRASTRRESIRTSDMARQLPPKGTFVIPARAYQALGAPAAVVEEVSNHVPHSPVPKAVTEYLIHRLVVLGHMYYKLLEHMK